MRALASLITSVLLLTAAACTPAAPARNPGVDAKRAATGTQAIINGEACPETRNPSAMAILLDATVDFGQFGGVTDLTTVMCTATLIAPDVVLTAAHCTDATGITFGFGEVQRAEFYVSFQSDLSAFAEQSGQGEPLEIPASAIPVRELVAHPEFELDAFNNGVNGPGDFKDVALLFLSTAITDVEPEIVITPEEVAQMTVGKAVEIAGWGQQTVTADPFTPPPAGTVGKKICGASTINEIGELEMQIGGDVSTTRKCHGDSGGPTYLEVTTDHTRSRRVIGITSHAYDQEDCNKGGIDTRVDVWIPWMDGEMVARCADGSRVWCDVDGVIPPSFYDPGAEGEGEGEGGADDDEDDEDEDRGCAAASPSVVGGLALVLLGARRRRRVLS